jgi:hypothetical protein
MLWAAKKSNYIRSGVNPSIETIDIFPQLPSHNVLYDTGLGIAVKVARITIREELAHLLETKPMKIGNFRKDHTKIHFPDCRSVN